MIRLKMVENGNWILKEMEIITEIIRIAALIIGITALIFVTVIYFKNKG
jgi:hypothetical protein